jgi:hypothetical protein
VDAVSGDPEDIRLIGPLEDEDGRLVLRIPLDVGGTELAPFAAGIGDIQGDVLCIRIPEWLAAKLEMQVGNLVQVGVQDGKLNISPFRDDA